MLRLKRPPFDKVRCTGSGEVACVPCDMRNRTQLRWSYLWTYSSEIVGKTVISNAVLAGYLLDPLVSVGITVWKTKSLCNYSQM
ncbi:hypothetical protein TNCV_4323121 [Trichonephila clavipes]|nr:hypothetical protein TNCV_4323121 [Trichonephila clavipes]